MEKCFTCKQLLVKIPTKRLEHLPSIVTLYLWLNYRCRRPISQLNKYCILLAKEKEYHLHLTPRRYLSYVYVCTCIILYILLTHEYHKIYWLTKHLPLRFSNHNYFFLLNFIQSAHFPQIIFSTHGIYIHSTTISTKKHLTI